MFSEKKARTSLENLKTALTEVSESIKARNKGLPIDMQYTAMLPEKIPNSITIWDLNCMIAIG